MVPRTIGEEVQERQRTRLTLAVNEESAMGMGCKLDECSFVCMACWATLDPILVVGGFVVCEMFAAAVG